MQCQRCKKPIQNCTCESALVYIDITQLSSNDTAKFLIYHLLTQHPDEVRFSRKYVYPLRHPDKPTLPPQFTIKFNNKNIQISLSHTIIKANSQLYIVLKKLTDNDAVIHIKNMVELIKKSLCTLELIQNSLVIGNTSYVVKKEITDPKAKKKQIEKEIFLTQLINGPIYCAYREKCYLSEISQRYYIIEHQLYGVDLTKVIPNGTGNTQMRPPLSDLLFITLQMLTELKMLHILGYVHMDVKPGNFMYNPKLKIVTIIDFGQTVEIESENGVGATGTLHYMPYKLELNDNGKEIKRVYHTPTKPETDISCLGKIFVEMFEKYYAKDTEMYLLFLETIIPLRQGKAHVSIDELIQKFTDLYWQHRQPHDDHCFLTSLSPDQIDKIDKIQCPEKIKHMVCHFPTANEILLPKLCNVTRCMINLRVISLRSHFDTTLNEGILTHFQKLFSNRCRPRDIQNYSGRIYLTSPPSSRCSIQ